jgi:hypothetical protein
MFDSLKLFFYDFKCRVLHNILDGSPYNVAKISLVSVYARTPTIKLVDSDKILAGRRQIVLVPECNIPDFLAGFGRVTF